MAIGGRRGTATTEDPGVEPLGRVRRSQLISTYGIGAIVDLEKGSYMPMGLEDWEWGNSLPSLSIGEPTLQALLGVRQFRLAPVLRDVRGRPGRVEARPTAPAVRFPQWHECPTCHRIGREGDPFELAADGARLTCPHGKAVPTNPVRFVTACRRGHMDEFPWIWWAHRGRDEGVCDTPVLFLRSRGQSASLADLRVECRNCNASESMGDALTGDGLAGARCSGFRPWLHDWEKDCNESRRGIQRGASNVHFPVVASALSIPPVSDAAGQIIEELRPTLDRLPTDTLAAVLEGYAENYDVPVDQLMAAYRHLQSLDGGASALTERIARAQEYAALSLDRSDPVIGGVVPQFENSIRQPSSRLGKWFDVIGAVSRLREVRALAGFSRIEPYPVSAERVGQAIVDGKVAPLSKSPRRWLPAAEIRGEGIFLRFDTEALEHWIAENPEVLVRAAALDARSAATAAERGYTRDYTITPRLLVVHSFAHALLRQISVDCGYSASALRERLYVAEPTSTSPAMNGVLIYTGSPDSEGSLGGLVRLADDNLLEPLVARTLANAEWCGSDPVCLETEPAQAGHRISGAACHCCLLLPETACEKFNRELDRTAMVGEADRRFRGFFCEALD